MLLMIRGHPGKGQMYICIDDHMQTGISYRHAIHSYLNLHLHHTICTVIHKYKFGLTEAFTLLACKLLLCHVNQSPTHPSKKKKIIDLRDVRWFSDRMSDKEKGLIFVYTCSYNQSNLFSHISVVTNIYLNKLRNAVGSTSGISISSLSSARPP